ncbi:MAG TPA: SGNH/GDSL hydrolase family protein [Anaerolineales bacterium]|nr:SGNH/GDSL hydrolase family protein [Anaerolineales bacterium]
MKSEINPIRVLVKALCLFVIINILYALIAPRVSAVSTYNLLFPGRTRLPFGISGDPYTVTVDNVDAMLASHLISTPKRSNEYRVVLLGDSSVWGEDLGAYEVISEQWNKFNVKCGDKNIRAYDLGYPHPSVIKDLVILDKAMEYQPDLIIWFVTLNTLISQRTNPFLDANREQVEKLVEAYQIPFKGGKKFTEDRPSFYEKTLIGQRSNLARQIKLQLLGMIWTASRSDTNTLAPDALTDYNVSDDPTYRGMKPPADLRDMLLFRALTAGKQVANSVPVLVVNEPIFIANEANAIVRYNPVYPRWAYDQYREAIATQAKNDQWYYLDLWNAVPPEDFSDAGLHLSTQGEQILIKRINPLLQSIGCHQ